MGRHYDHVSGGYVGEPDDTDADDSDDGDDGDGWDDRADDYLDQNHQTVRSNLEDDDLDEEFLEDLLAYEQSNNDRDSVVEALEDALGEG